MVRGVMFLPDGKRVLDGRGDVALGPPRGPGDVVSQGQVRGDGRGERAARAVRVFGVDAARLEESEVRSVKKDIDGVPRGMPAR